MPRKTLKYSEEIELAVEISPESGFPEFIVGLTERRSIMDFVRARPSIGGSGSLHDLEAVKDEISTVLGLTADETFFAAANYGVQVIALSDVAIQISATFNRYHGMFFHFVVASLSRPGERCSATLSRGQTEQVLKTLHWLANWSFANR